MSQDSNISPERKKLCLIDDDQNIREMYTLALTAEDFDVFTASDGEEGLALIRKEHPDAILLDLQMPVKDGFDVLREIQEDKNISKIPVVILSNMDNEDAFRKAGTFETQFFLVKALTTPRKAASIVRELFTRM